MVMNGSTVGGAVSPEKPAVPPLVPQLRIVEGTNVRSFQDFLELRGARKDEPILLRNVSFTLPADRFTLETLAEELKDLKLPEKSLSAKQGGNASQCALLLADQGKEEVMTAKPKLRDPEGCSFQSLAEKICHDRLYLSTRSGKARVHRSGSHLHYDKVEDPEGKDVLVTAFLERVPFPLFLPEDSPCQVAFWMGSEGNNFGLHTDLFTEQFLCQHQGTKEVLLLLPEDAGLVDPFPFLETTLYYKSQSRTVRNLKAAAARETLTLRMTPGDVLYIPFWWWHEVRTLEGPSVSTTYRFHCEDADRFLKVMNLFYQFHKTAKEYGSGRLAAHLRSFFIHALQDRNMQGKGCLSTFPITTGALCFALGFLVASWVKRR